MGAQSSTAPPQGAALARRLSSLLGPPGLPAGAGRLPGAAGEIEGVTEVFAGERAQLLLGGLPDLGGLVGEPLEQPIDPIVVLVLLPPGGPALGFGPEVLLGDRHQLGLHLLHLIPLLETFDEAGDVAL